MKKGLFLVAALTSTMAARAETKWIDGEAFLKGRLTHGSFEVPYYRLPDDAFKNQNLKRLHWSAHTSTGLYLAFRTDSRDLAFRVTIRSSDIKDVWCGPAAFFGVDVYTRQSGKWRWERIRTDDPRAVTQTWTCRRITGGEGVMAYLPMRGCTRKVEIGIDEGASIEPLPRPAKKVVHYGTSLVHGGCVARSGMIFTSLYARRLGLELVNLGFSGAAHMQSEVVDYMAGEDCSLYVVDAALNNTPAEILERLGPFVKRLRAARPDTPILVCEPADTFATETERSLAVRKVFGGLVAEGIGGLHTIHTSEQMCDDGEGTVDGVHPNEWGAMQMAQGFTTKIAAILNLK